MERGLRWERFATSRALYICFLVMFLAATAWIALHLRGQVAQDLRREAVRSAQLISDVTFVGAAEEGVTGAELLTSEGRGVLDAESTTLIDRGTISGLSVWSRRGWLVYADPTHLGHVFNLDPTAVERAQKGQVWSRPAPTAGNPGMLTGAALQVFIPHDGAGDGEYEAVVAVSVPEAPIAAQLRQEGNEIMAVAILLVLIAFVLVTWARRALLRREARALTDAITGLPNRAALTARLQAAAARGEPQTLLVIALDDVAAVTDSLGHEAGELLLVQVSERVRSGLRPGDLVARLDGDGFAVLLPTDRREAGRSVAVHLLQALRGAPYVVQGAELGLEPSIGISSASEPHTVLELLHRAHVAARQAARTASDVMPYAPELEEQSGRQLSLLARFRRALDDDELVLHYQPRARLGSGDLTGVEALIRWQHPSQGLLGPDTFVPLVEASRLVRPMTLWVMREAVRQAAQWSARGLMLPVAVNVSPPMLLDETFTDTVLEMLGDAGVGSDLLELEITETAVMRDPNRVVAACRKLRAAGVRIAIDDFGTGHASMAYLKDLPADTLKIDRSFVTDILTEPRQEAIVASLVTLAHRLQLTVVAEGIEDADVWEHLAELGADEGQGYFLAKPLPADELGHWLTLPRAVPVTRANRGTRRS